MGEEKDQVEVHEGRPVGIVVSVRLKAEDAALLEQLAALHRLSASETMRRGLHALRNQPLPLGQAFTGGGATETLSVPAPVVDYTPGQPRILVEG